MLLGRPPSWYFYDSYNSGSVRGDLYIDGVRRAGINTPVSNDGNWYHVAYSYDSRTRTANSYRNGTLSGTVTLSGLSNYLN